MNEDLDKLKFEDLFGRIPVRIQGSEKGSEELRIETQDGLTWTLYHAQDCCESVYLDDITGDLWDLIGEPLLEAEEVSSGDPMTDDRLKTEAVKMRIQGYPDHMDGYYAGDSETWTFYKLRTKDGAVTLRWYGSSNGYYSESVDLRVERT